VEEKFVEFGCDLKQRAVASLGQRAQFLCLRVQDHATLLLVEEEPNAHDGLEVFFGHFLKMGL